MYRETYCCGHNNCADQCVCEQEYCPGCNLEHDCICDARTDAYLERDLFDD